MNSMKLCCVVADPIPSVGGGRTDTRPIGHCNCMYIGISEPLHLKACT